MTENKKTPQDVRDQGELKKISTQIAEIQYKLNYLFWILLIHSVIRAFINTGELIIGFIGS